MQQQHLRRLALFLGGTALVAGGLFVAACSSDSDTNTATPRVDSGNTNKADGSGNNNEDGSSDTTDGGDLAADCGNAPKLRSNANGFYCPFLDGGDAGRYCGNDTTCCNPAKGPDGTYPATFCADSKGGTDVCKTYAEANDLSWPENAQLPGTQWECADNAACGGEGNVCCAYTGSQYSDPNDKVNVGNTNNTDIPKACDAKELYKAGGTHCQVGSCPAGEIKLCSVNDNNCTAGTVCTPMTDFLNKDLGYCK